MSPSGQRVRDLVSEEAAHWFIENRQGLDPEQQRAFIAWAKASPLHVEEYLALTAVAQDLPSACRPDSETLEQLVASARLAEDPTVHALRPPTAVAGRALPARRWQPFALTASLSSLCVGLFALAHYWPAGAPPVASDSTALHLQTRHGEQQTYRLGDHSVIHLNTDSAVTVRFDRRERLVILETGEAAFEVAHEPGRAFRVFAGAAQVVDVGTQFDVRLGPAATLVTVTEGRVQVGLASNTEYRMPTLDLTTGQQIRVADGDWPTRPMLVDAQRITAWLRHQIKFDNEPLARVVSEFNRYAPTPFVIAAPALESMKISGVFSTDDPGAFIAFLRSFQGVQVDVTVTGIRVTQH